MAFHPEFVALLPADALEKFKILHNDDSLDSMTRFDKMVEVMLALPADLQAKIEALPPPPTHDMLPDEMKSKMDAIRTNKSLSFKDKCAKYREVIASMPEDLRAKIREAAKKLSLGK